MPLELDRVVGKALSKNPAERHQHVEDMLVDLKALRKLAGGPRRAGPGKRGHLLGAAAVGALGASLVWATVFWRSPKPEVVLPTNAAIRRLTSYTGTERDPAISPDGRSFAYVSSTGGQPDIWVRQVSGGEPLQLTRDGVSESELVYGPDGETLYYTASGAIWKIGSLGGTPYKVVAGASAPSLSADGTRLAYMRGWTIYVASADGTGETRYVRLSGFRSGFSLSPDGRRIAFIQGGLFENASLLVVDLDRGSPRKLIDLGFGGISAPGWLPDSRTIVFTRTIDQSPLASTTDLWMMSISGGPARRLTLNHLGHFNSLRLSRDGRRLLASLVVSEREVWKAPLDSAPEANGKAAQRLIDNSANPMWIQASGSTLLYSGVLTGTRNLWVMPLDRTGAARQVTSMADNSVTHAALSPEGAKVAFSSLQTGNAEIWTMNTDGSNPVQMTRSASAESWPTWSADGKRPAFRDEGSGQAQLWKMPSSGGEPVRLTRNGGVRGDSVANGQPDRLCGGRRLFSGGFCGASSSARGGRFRRESSLVDQVALRRRRSSGMEP